MDKQNPSLVRQVLGAIAGAAVAFVLYQSTVTIAPKLHALIALPTAPGVMQQDTLRTATTEDLYNRDRMERRAREIAEQFGRNEPGSVRRDRSTDQTTIDAIPQAPIDGAVSGQQGEFPLRPVDAPSESAENASSSAATSAARAGLFTPPANRVMYGPFGWLRNAKKFLLPVSSSSSIGQSAAASSSAQPAVTAPVAGATLPTEESAQSSADPELMETEELVAPQPLEGEEPVEQEPVAAPEPAPHEEIPVVIIEEPPPMPPYEGPPMIGAIKTKSTRLPQSGLGLGAIAFMAVGAAVGRRARKSVQPSALKGRQALNGKS